MNKLYSFWILAVVLWMSVPVSASPGWNFVLEDVLRPRGQYYDLTSFDNRLYLACKRGVEIYSIEDPDNPEFLGSLLTDGLANGVALNFPYLYVGDVYGFSIWDVTDPAGPIYLSGFRRVSAEGYQERLTYRDGYVYVAAYSSGLQIIDVSDPLHPFILSTADTPAYAWDLALIDTTAYMMDFFSMEIIDITRPQAPLHRTSVSAMFAGGIRIRDDLAFIAYIDGLLILDISNRYAPSVVCEPGTTGSGAGESVELLDHYAIVAHQGYVEVYDVTDPRDPYQVSFFNVPGHPRKLHVAGNHLYTILDDSGFHVTDLTDPESPVPGRHIDPSTWGSRQDVVVHESNLYLCDWNRGLVVYDISTGSPVEIASYSTPGMLNEIFFDGTRAYLSCYSELQILDMTSPSSPTFLGAYRTSGNPWGIWATGDRAFLCDLYSFHVLDVSDPGQVRRLGAVILSGTGTPYRTIVRDGKAFVAHGYGGLKVIDVTDAADPEIISSYPGDNSRSYSTIELIGNRLFALNSGRGIDCLDVTDPVHITEIGAIDLGDAQVSDFHISATTLFASASSGGVFAVDITDIGSPRVTGWIDTPGTAAGIDSKENTVFVADDFDLAVLSYSGGLPDPTGPQINILQPSSGMTAPEKNLLIQGVASDPESGIAQIEISFDGGTTWEAGRGQETWSYLLSGRMAGPVEIRARAINRAGLTTQTAPQTVYLLPAAPLVLLGGFETTRVGSGPVTASVLVFDPYDPAYIEAVEVIPEEGAGQALDRIAENSGIVYFSKTSAWNLPGQGVLRPRIQVIDALGNPANTWPYLVVRP